MLDLLLLRLVPQAQREDLPAHPPLRAQGMAQVGPDGETPRVATAAPRTPAGLAAARARGRHGGRPSVLTGHKLRVAEEMYRSGQYTVAAIAKTLGVSRASIYRHLIPADS